MTTISRPSSSLKVNANIQRRHREPASLDAGCCQSDDVISMFEQCLPVQVESMTT